MKRVSILSISQASFTSVNRVVYRELKLKGWDIQLVVPSQLNFSGGNKNAEPMQKDDPLIHFLQLDGTNPRIQKYKGLKKLLRRLRPRIIYLDNDPASLMAAGLSIWCRMNNSVLICQSCENLSIKLNKVFQREGWSGMPAAFAKNFFSFFSHKFCSHVFAISDRGVEVFRELGYKSVSKIPLGFDESIFHTDDKERNRIRAVNGLNKIVFSYFGRLVAEKGVHLLITALSNIKEFEWQLLMDDFNIYASSYTNEIKKQIENLQLTDRVVYFHASHTEIASYMNAADVIILPSVSTPKWIEQYGRVIPEAMACGKLVIVSDAGALPELVADAGIVFKENNIEQLTQLLRDIIINPGKYKTFYELAYKRAHTYLSVKQQAAVMHSKFIEFAA